MRLKSHCFAVNQLRVYILGLDTVTYVGGTRGRGSGALGMGKLAVLQRSSTEGGFSIHTGAGGSLVPCLIVQTQGLEVAGDT